MMEGCCYIFLLNIKVTVKSAAVFSEYVVVVVILLWW